MKIRKLMSPESAALRLGISHQELADVINHDDLSYAENVTGGGLFISLDELERYEATRPKQAAPALVAVSAKKYAPTIEDLEKNRRASRAAHGVHYRACCAPGRAATINRN